jgi:hypothetical protein
MNPARLLIFAVFSLMVMTIDASVGDKEAVVWRSVTPAELQMKAPQVEPDADAEAIFWEIRIDDKKDSKLTYSHYVRVKIFTERGRERFAKMDIPFVKGKKVENVAARVIKPDGTIVELQPSDIFDREIAAAGKVRVQAKSFAVPGIEPGVIVEYQYTETIKGESAGGDRLIFQRDIPLERVTYYIRPNSSASLKFNSFNMPDLRFVKGQDGFSVATMENIPAYKSEPFMPPADEVRKWAFLHYQTFGSLFQWNTRSLYWEAVLQQLAKPNKEIKQKAAELTAGAATDGEKLHCIFDFVQKNIKNLSYDKNYSDEQIDKLDIKDADDALRRGMGRSSNIDLLFAALTRAAGLETMIVLAADRSENFFTTEKYPFASFIDWTAIAVRADGKWVYFDPCAPFLPFGKLTWNREDVKAMIIGETGHQWVTLPLTDVSESVAKRTGNFELSADGTLTGTVRLEYNGQQAISRRREEIRDSDAKREENIRDEIKKKISAAEISELSIENFADNSKPLTYTFKVRVPNYAQKVGKRLILQPGFFEYGSSPVFSSATRVYDVYFPYPWSEKDEVRIKLPANMQIESADSPAEVADSGRIGVDRIRISIDTVPNVLIYRRDFHFGAGGHTLFQVSVYPALKKIFDSFYGADTHAVALKQSTN